MFAKENRGRTDLTATDEGYPLSWNLLEKGYMTEEELCVFPAANVRKAECTPLLSALIIFHAIPARMPAHLDASG
jgi:hypothetical protein